MQNRTRVVVYGNTLTMAGIAASLKAEESLEVICVDPHEPTARQSLIELDPKTILFDRTEPHPELDLVLLREQPGLLLVGVDPSSDDALVLSGQFTRVLSGKDLAKLVTENGQGRGE
ncbi:MAG TPA: hypothetical protein VLR89_02220 [Anaerolineaceae bacterium]|nr:hypothetical protein [Anaerolineaceae bacterium]